MFTLAPEFSVVTRQMTSEYQQRFAVYDVKQWSKWNAFSILAPFATYVSLTFYGCGVIIIIILRIIIIIIIIIIIVIINIPIVINK